MLIMALLANLVKKKLNLIMAQNTCYLQKKKINNILNTKSEAKILTSPVWLFHLSPSREY